MQIVKTLMTNGDQEYWILWCTEVEGMLGNGSYLEVIRHGKNTLLISWFLLFSSVQCGG